MVELCHSVVKLQMAMKKILKDDRASLILGDKIKGFGDPNSRTRKRLEHQPYVVSCCHGNPVVTGMSASLRR